MASTLVTVPTTTPFLSVNKTKGSFLSQLKFEVPKRDSLRINAISKKWEPTKVVPQADRVLIRLEDLPEKSSGGVLLPKSAVKFERYLMGEVLSVGAEAGEVEAGKRVLFSDINAYEVNSITIQRNLHPTAYDVHSMPSFRRDLDRCNIDSSVICMSDHRYDCHHTRCIANCPCSWMRSYKILETMQIDLGTDAKHCFCKAGDLLAVVE
ncbi:hypothetical protein DKX38_002780 [Salix brachista]|uniref:Uncharacterized protein n=1 Tax=Salix brachista TaxID=2182728 RepID=A0A5N5NPL0_9ROSI|nr:hypothetical protein DKX38_002780 [Salix brachista]